MTPFQIARGLVIRVDDCRRTGHHSNGALHDQLQTYTAVACIAWTNVIDGIADLIQARKDFKQLSFVYFGRGRLCFH